MEKLGACSGKAPKKQHIQVLMLLLTKSDIYKTTKVLYLYNNITLHNNYS